MVPSGNVPMYFTVRLPSLQLWSPTHHGFSSSEGIALNIFGHEVRVGMQNINTICTALVFVVHMFLCQLVDAHSEVEYITLKNVSKSWCYFKVSNCSFLTELQEKNEKMFTLMSSSQKCHVISVGLHAWPYTCRLLCSLLLCGLLVHGSDPICVPFAFPTLVLHISPPSSYAIFSEQEVLFQAVCSSFFLLK